MSPSSSEAAVVAAKMKAEEEDTDKAMQMTLVPGDVWNHNCHLTWNGFANLFATRKWHEERLERN